ncbi:MAG: 2-C-methyl-D-erythritol 4-phosphate cytidylyltransferase [Solirubrobacteraceae bacterium]
MAVALIVAAGRGERLGSDGPKALVTLGGVPMLEWSLRSLRAVKAVEAIVIALPPQTVASSPLLHLFTAVSGGATRSHSVRAALAAAPAGDPVIVHDAARPLATPELFERALAELAWSGADAVVAATPVPDTIKEVGDDGRTVARTLARTDLWAVQTPQVFRREILERELSAASDALLARATDDAWLIERAGGVVRVLAADPANIKVTSPADLRVAELLLSERRR